MKLFVSTSALLASAVLSSFFFHGAVAMITGGGESNTRNGSRHLTSSSSATALDEEAFEGVKALCHDVDYDVSLYVTQHIFLVAVPTTKKTGCYPLAFHADTSTDEGLMQKAVLQVDQDEVIAMVQEDSISLDSTYKLGAIAASYEMSDVNTDGANGYEIIQNNCGDFIKEMSKNMDIKMNKDHTVAIAARLVEHAGDEFGSRIKESSYVDSLIGDLNVKMVTQKLVERLVESRTKELY